MAKGYTEKELKIAASNIRLQYGVIKLLIAECRKIRGKDTCFEESLKLLRDLADLQNGAPLVTYEEEWNKTMDEIWQFLDKHEK